MLIQFKKHIIKGDLINESIYDMKVLKKLVLNKKRSKISNICAKPYTVVN